LNCLEGVEFVLCPQCHVVSPTLSKRKRPIGTSAEGRVVALGFTGRPYAGGS
jgi:hypothetical protein